VRTEPCQVLRRRLARAAILATCCAHTFSLAQSDAAAIPFRPETQGLGSGAATASGIALVLLALAVIGLYLLRRNLTQGACALPTAETRLRCIASIRLPAHARVHVVAYRDREWLFVQSGDQLMRLAQLEAKMAEDTSFESRA
jgi:hypothetical protein